MATNQLMVKIVFDRWHSLLKICDTNLNSISDEQFVKSPDKSVESISSAKELRAIWKSQMESLTPKLESLSADEWFEKHNSVSAEDFEKGTTSV
ncbi:MAG: hypothetical protein ABI691_16650 [Ginsengibacter sp.]